VTYDRPAHRCTFTWPGPIVPFADELPPPPPDHT
jgi:hypothetical protein